MNNNNNNSLVLRCGVHQGAQYGGKLAAYEALEETAKAQKVGMWSLGADLETAAEYKKRTSR